MTLIQDAELGKCELVEKVANQEKLDYEKICKKIIAGKIVIPFNPIHYPEVLGIGESLSVKVNVNVGTSPDYTNIDEELQKVNIAVKYGTNTIMDLSIGGNINEIRKKIIQRVKIPVGTVPIYQACLEAIKKYGSVGDMNEDILFNAIEEHAKDGVDFMTLHCGVTKECIEKLKLFKRTTGIVSRGGAFIACWMLKNNLENPLYKNFDYILEIAKKYDITLSLGDGLRPGCIKDSSDVIQFQELLVLSELVKRSRNAKVQAMVEGPGHLLLSDIEANIKLEKSICHGAPFYVLGPIVTDIAPGYDHIVGAIGGALAGYYGADFLCYVTPGEHLALPTIEDVKEGLMVSKIAAHVANICKGINIEKDYEMALARWNLDWNKQFKLAIDKEKAEKYRTRRPPSTATCSMCGDLCAMKIIKEVT